MTKSAITFSKKYLPYRKTTYSRYDILIDGVVRGHMDITVHGEYNRWTRRNENWRRISAHIDDNWKECKLITDVATELHLLRWERSQVPNRGGIVGAKKTIVKRLEKLIESLDF